VLKNDDQAAIADDPIAADRQHSRGLTEQHCVLAPMASRSFLDHRTIINERSDASSI
jgi:hypothetical protein